MVACNCNIQEGKEEDGKFDANLGYMVEEKKRKEEGEEEQKEERKKRRKKQR